MKPAKFLALSIICVLFACLPAGCCSQPEVSKRIGMVVGLKPEAVAEYKRLHADECPGVRDLLTKYNLSNFSIYLTEIDGKYYEFGYWEYTGDDYAADMAAIAKEERNIEWLRICNPMQIPLEGETGWREMELVYRNP